jgi:hypothetical protein
MMATFSIVDQGRELVTFGYEPSTGCSTSRRTRRRSWNRMTSDSVALKKSTRVLKPLRTAPSSFASAHAEGYGASESKVMGALWSSQTSARTLRLIGPRCIGI